jgi:hypothetical protein
MTAQRGCPRVASNIRAPTTTTAMRSRSTPATVDRTPAATLSAKRYKAPSASRSTSAIAPATAAAKNLLFTPRHGPHAMHDLPNVPRLSPDSLGSLLVSFSQHDGAGDESRTREGRNLERKAGSRAGSLGCRGFDWTRTQRPPTWKVLRRKRGASGCGAQRLRV